MAFQDFQSYLKTLAASGELHRTGVEIDPALELTEVSIRALQEGKPALLVEHPKGSHYPLVINHFASEKRIEIALGSHPNQIGEELVSFLDHVYPLTLKTLFENKKVVMRFFHTRPRKRNSGISQEIIAPPNLDVLPIQVCWPKDGGKFITYGQVITYDPHSIKRNIGIYRLHVFDNSTTGMHWQIQKGGGFHYFRSEKMGKEFEVAIALGTAPALLIATVAPLPEGIDEAMFAGFLANKRIEFIQGKTISIHVPASAEFVLEGIVPLKERRLEGPFGDHFGHYSASAAFPVFHLRAITHRRDPIYPAIVVGKPPMEDKFLGDAAQQMLSPLFNLIHPEVRSLWAYYEAGFHNLLVAAIEQRYQKEAIKAALGMLGTEQLSLTKCMIMVSAVVDVRNWHAVLQEIRNNFDPHYDFIIIPKAPLDTLDFTSYTMNLGSKMVIDATRKAARDGRAKVPKTRQLQSHLPQLTSEEYRILDLNLIEDTLLLVKVSSDGSQIVKKLVKDPRLAGLPLLVCVSEDVDIHKKESYIWGIFTRFDCERDVVFSEQKLIGISPVYKGTMGIDATWKPGYPQPLSMPEEITARVDEKWGKIWRS